MSDWMPEESEREALREASQPSEEAPRPLDEPTRDELGQVVRAAWCLWASQQPNPKPSWLVPWEELNETDREADRCIGAAIYALARPEAAQPVAPTNANECCKCGAAACRGAKLKTVCADCVPDAPTLIKCGAWHPDAEIDERSRLAAEEMEGYAGPEGCGVEMLWTYAYRCAECGRWFHRDHLVEHFAKHRADAPTPDALEREKRIAESLNEIVTLRAARWTWLQEHGFLIVNEDGDLYIGALLVPDFADTETPELSAEERAALNGETNDPSLADEALDRAVDAAIRRAAALRSALPQVKT